MNNKTENLLMNADTIEKLENALLCQPYNDSWSSKLIHVNYQHNDVESIEIGYNITNGCYFVCSLIIKVIDENRSNFTNHPDDVEYHTITYHQSSYRLYEKTKHDFYFKSKDGYRITNPNPKILLNDCHITDLARAVLNTHIFINRLTLTK